MELAGNIKVLSGPDVVQPQSRPSVGQWLTTWVPWNGARVSPNYYIITEIKDYRNSVHVVLSHQQANYIPYGTLF